MAVDLTIRNFLSQVGRPLGLHNYLFRASYKVRYALRRHLSKYRTTDQVQKQWRFGTKCDFLHRASDFNCLLCF